MMQNSGDMALIIAVTVVCYINSLHCQFVFDDISAIVNNRNIRTNESSVWSLFWSDYWGTPIHSEHSHKSYRPLTVITFRLNYLLNGINPFGYHLVNVSLHTAVCLLYYHFCVRLLKHSKSALISSLLFCVHPLKTEAVTGVVGRAELLSTLFFFVSLFAYSTRKYVYFIVTVICAILSKEQGITVLAVCFVRELCDCIVKRKPTLIDWRSISKCIFLLTFGVALLAIRVSIMGGKNSLPVFTKFDNPASFESYPTRHLTYNYLLPLNSLLLIYPYNLCCDWTMKSISLIHTFWDQRNVWTLLFYVVFGLLLYRSLVSLIYQKCDRLVIAMALIVFPFIPATNLFFAVGFVIAERTLYTPSAGFCLLLAIGYQRLENSCHFCGNKLKEIFVLMFCVTIFAFALKTQSRNNDWKNELTLFSSAIEVNPLNAKLYNNIGHYYERIENYSKAIEYFKLASDCQTDDLGSDINIARTLINMGHTHSAEQMLWKLKPRVKLSAVNKRIIPSYLSLWINLANIISRNESRLSEAEILYRELIGMRSDFVEAYINLGDILIRQNKIWEAIDTYKTGANYWSNSKQRKADLYYNIGVAYSMIFRQTSHLNRNNSEQIQQIAQYLWYAIRVNPYHKEALINLAILAQQHQNLLKTYRQLLINKMKQYSSSDDTQLIYFNLALLMSDEGDNDSAVHYLKKAISVKNDFRSALFNLALIMIESENYSDAEYYLKQLLSYHRNHTKSLLLLGNLYINHLNDLDSAEQNYLEVLKYNLTNIEAIHNLCVIYSRRHKTKEAQQCFKKVNALNMAINL